MKNENKIFDGEPMGAVSEMTPENRSGYIHALTQLMNHELEKVEECNRILEGFGNTNLTITTDEGSCHVHTCRGDSLAMNVTHHVEVAIKALRDRHIQASHQYLEAIEDAAKTST